MNHFLNYSAVLLFLIGLTPRAGAQPSAFADSLSEAAIALTRQQVVYDPSYFRIDYPMGDVPADRGVCTDVVIRAFRKVGIDLQQEVHEDMATHFNLYPNRWGLRRTDKNIDHRRVPNLMTFLGRHGRSLPLSDRASDYRAGDIVCWDLGGGILHIGLVADRKSTDGQRPLIVHNIGRGQVLEDVLFSFSIIGHYRYP